MLLILSPLIGEQSVQFTGLHRINSPEYIGEICNRVDVLAPACGDKREVNGHGATAGIGTDEEKVFSSQNEGFDGSFGRVVVDVEIGIAEEAMECNPVFEGVPNCFHERMRRMQRALQFAKPPAQFFSQWFRPLAADRQSVDCRLAFNFPFYFVECGIYLDYFVADFVIAPSGVSAASGFRLSAIFEQLVEAAGGICLDDAGKSFEKLCVAEKRLIGREVKHNCGMFGIATIDSHLALAHSTSGYPILNLDGTVISLDDAGGENLFLQAFPKWFKGKRTGLEPVAQRGTRNGGIFTFEDLRLTVLRQSIIAFVHNGRSKQAGPSQSARNGRTGLARGDNILSALGTAADFLLVFKALDAVQKLFELVAGFVFQKDGVDLTLRAYSIRVAHLMRDRLGVQVLSMDVLLMVAIFRLSARLGKDLFSWHFSGRRGPGIMSLGCRPMVFSVSFLFLIKQFVELRL